MSKFSLIDFQKFKRCGVDIMLKRALQHNVHIIYFFFKRRNLGNAQPIDYGTFTVCTSVRSFMDATLGISVIIGQKFDSLENNCPTYEYFNGLPLFTQKT